MTGKLCLHNNRTNVRFNRARGWLRVVFDPTIRARRFGRVAPAVESLVSRSSSDAGFVAPRGKTAKRRSGTPSLPVGRYPRYLEETHELPGGEIAFLRPIRPADAPALREGFKKLTPKDVRQRFFLSMADLRPAMADRLCRIDYERHMALVAMNNDCKAGTDGWGVARLVADPDGRRAEFAIIVRSDLQGRGIGSLLMDRLLAYARSRGIEQIWGNVLADNAAMLAFARKLGFTIGASPEEPEALRVSKPLSAMPVQPFARSRSTDRPVQRLA